MKEYLAILLFIILLGMIGVLGMREISSAPYTTYRTANDGGYIPVTYYPCKVISTAEMVMVVEHEGELYSCFYNYDGADPHAMVGKILWCGFSSYEGNVEFVDVKGEDLR